MKRKAVLSQVVSRGIRSMGLPREVLLDLLSQVHDVIALAYEFFREKRDSNNARYCLYRKILSDKSGVKHRFTFTIDDTTSPDHLIVVHLQHAINQ